MRRYNSNAEGGRKFKGQQKKKSYTENPNNRMSTYSKWARSLMLQVSFT